MTPNANHACRMRTPLRAGNACLLALGLVCLGATGGVYADLPAHPGEPAVSPAVNPVLAQQAEPPPKVAAEAPDRVAAEGKPAKRESLFGDDVAPAAKPGKPASRDSLFGDDVAPADKAAPTSRAWRGFIQGEAAHSFRDPEHWSKGRLRMELNRQGQFSESVKWKIGARFDYDGVYDHSGFYAPDVKRDQRYEFTLRENYIDVSAGDLEFRFGRQHVVWGEMVGLFIADVVSARDMREFILPEPELEMLRIPQWAARAEYFMKDMKAELLWIPVPSFDEIGKPGIPGVRGAAGADFYPYPIPGPGGTLFLGEQIPSRKLSNTNYGARLSALKSGLDMSAFYYHSLDIAPTFYREVLPGPGPAPVFRYQARHDSIDQFGVTLAKDFGDVVAKAEGVYTAGRQFNVTRLAQPNGLVRQNTFDYAIGLDFNLPADTRLNVQFFQRIFRDHDPDILQRKYESGASLLLDGKLGNNVEARALLIHSLNRSDWLFRPKITWMFEKNWRLAFGVDIFGGPATGLFGRFDNNDRVYTELRYSF